MSYDPTKDEPVFTMREMEALLSEAIEKAFKAGRDTERDLGAYLPLEIFGRWERGRVYATQSLVFHAGRQWISTMQTAAEPSDDTTAWRRVHFPHIRDTTPEGKGE